MKSRRHFLISSAAGLAAMQTWRVAHAQGDAVRILVGFPGGGIVDVVARHVAEQLRVQLGRTVIIENRPGAGGQLVVTALRNAAPDGNTLLLNPSSVMTLLPHVLRKLSFDPLNDFAAVSPVSRSYSAIVAANHVPATTLQEFVTWAKANPALANYASPGTGTGPHFLGAQLARLSGTEMLHVPYKGAPQIFQDLYGGRLAAFTTGLSNVVVPHREGKMRILAISSDSRLALLPDVPTFTEAGYPALSSKEWFGVFAPSRTPPERIQALSAAVAGAVSSEPVKAAFAKMLIEPFATPPAAFAKLVKADHDRWGRIIRELNYEPTDG